MNDEDKSEMVEVNLTLSEERALALAQMCKRMHLDICMQLSVNEDEAFLMSDAVSVLRKSLSTSGYSPS